MSDEVRTLRANGIQLAYRTWGDENSGGTPVVLLHCLGEDGEDWRGPLIAQLAAAHPLYALDLRGHGRSDWPGEYGLDQSREDLRGFLDALGLDRVILIGHSYGSMVAYLFAGEHPSRVERLVLEETAALLPLDPPREIPEEPEERQQFDWEVRRQFNQQRNAPDPRWWESLGEITAPTLLIGGGPTSHLPQEDLVVMAERIPGATLVTIEDAGHLVHEERPGPRCALAGRRRRRAASCPVSGVAPAVLCPRQLTACHRASRRSGPVVAQDRAPAAYFGAAAKSCRPGGCSGARWSPRARGPRLWRSPQNAPGS
jgi:pimeloyl-ACP methyl ester carboxylesterase